jgi:hypothetical protein
VQFFPSWITTEERDDDLVDDLDDHAIGYGHAVEEEVLAASPARPPGGTV